MDLQIVDSEEKEKELPPFPIRLSSQQLEPIIVPKSVGDDLISLNTANQNTLKEGISGRTLPET